MQDKQDTSELIERYLQGKLQHEELKQFRDLLASEKGDEIREDIYFLHTIKNITTEHEEELLQKQAQAWIKETENNIQSQHPQHITVLTPQKNKKWYYLAGIAASITLILFSLFLFYKAPSSPPPQILAQEYWSDYARLSPTVRGSNIHQAFNFFNSGEYAKVTQSLSKIPSTSPFYINALLLRGTSFYMLQKVDSAKIILQQAINHKESLLIDEAKWRLALVYVLENNYNAAKNILNELQHLRGYQSKATELLQSLPN